MGSKLYVGNLPFDTGNDELKLAFTQSGTVLDVRIITDRETGRSRGFGFVTMASDDEAKIASDEWNGRAFGGRNLIVNEAIEKVRDTSHWVPRSSNGGNGGNVGYTPQPVVENAPIDDVGRKRRGKSGSRARRRDQEDY